MSGATEPPAGGLLWLALRSALGSALGALAGAAVYLDPGVRSEWHLAAFVGLFLGSLAGPAGRLERAGVGRGLLAHVGLAFALFVAATVWSAVGLCQAEWTGYLVMHGLDSARARLVGCLDAMVFDPAQFLRYLAPLAAALAVQSLVRMRAGGPNTGVLAATPALLLGALLGDRDTSLFILAVGLGVLAGNAASAWLAHALAKKWRWTEVAGT